MRTSVQPKPETTFPIRLSRRRLVAGSGVALATTGIASIGAATTLALQGTPEASPVAAEPPEVAQEVGRPAAYFNIHEAPDGRRHRLPDPPRHGGRSRALMRPASSSTSIVILAGTNLGYPLKTYTQGPFPVVSEEPVPVEAASTRDIYDFVDGRPEQISRYGYQSVLSPQEIYRRGLEFVDAYAQSQFQKNFIDLNADQQDQILTDMEADKATGFDGPGAKAFFTQLRNDTIEGMFSDPMYGGNRDMVGWKLIGYPGAQRFYTPDDIKNPNFNREPQSSRPVDGQRRALGDSERWHRTRRSTSLPSAPVSWPASWPIS